MSLPDTMPDMGEEVHTWDPMLPEEVQDLLAGLDAPWWLAGGFAIEDFVGRELREHGDTDVVVRFEDQLRVQEYLSGWELHKTKQPGLAPWPKGEVLAPPVEDVWCRMTPDGPWRLQLMLLLTSGDRWVFKRNPDIGGPLAEFGRMSSTGMPCIRPEIQLLYKAREETLEKDEIDFAATVSLLVEPERRWLRENLVKQFPAGHPWIDHLS